VKATADALVKGRYLRAEDEKQVVDDAGKHWDWSMSQQATQAKN